jgi:opacity protein-like surface antigen
MEVFMKKILLFAVAVLLLLSQAAFAADTGLYFGIKGGYVIPRILTISDPDDSANYLDTSLNNGYLGGVTFGWNTPFTNRILAMELEYNYIHHNFDNGKIYEDASLGHAPSAIPGTLDATLSIHALFFNLKARFPNGRFHPYVGGGVGYAYASVGDITGTASDGSGSGTIKGSSGSGLCYQFLAGLDFDITPNFGVGLGYKYMVSKPTMGSKNADDGSMYMNADYKASAVTLGLNFSF